MSGAYYNDNEPYVCAWLRNLIKANLIAPGDVDERSIKDVKADDLKGYTQAHFFAGIGGWSYALRLAGWPDEEPCWTGSCPCQPLSVAGNRKGHADERHLWPAFHGLITERKPPIVFGEQVSGRDGHEWLSAVRSDLETNRYAVGAADLCPTTVGCPQRRWRLFWVADASFAKKGGQHSSFRGRIGEYEGLEKIGWAADWRESCEVRVLDDGLPGRVAKALANGFGNAIVPQVAAEFIKAVMECRP